MEHEQVIERLGGVRELAKATRQNERAVRGWKERKKIPPKHWPVIVAAAKHKGVPVSYESLAKS